MTPLLATVEASGISVADRLVSSHRGRVALVGPSGIGKATALRHTKQVLGGEALLLEATDDDIAPVVLLNGLADALNAAGHQLEPTHDAEGEMWEGAIHRVEGALENAGDQEPIVLVNGVERLERLAGGGGVPGRHADELLRLLDTRVRRLGVSGTVSGHSGEQTVSIDAQDLGDWLTDAEAWDTLAPAAAEVAERGATWRRLPALSLRLAVGLAHLDALPATAPPTPMSAGRMLANEVCTRRPTRGVWAAWQLVAALRGPLDRAALDVLLDDLPEGVVEDPLLTRCLLFPDNGWRLHPSLREVIRQPRSVAAERMLPEDLVHAAGRRIVEHFREKSAEFVVQGQLEAAGDARAAAIDACAMTGPDAVILVEQFADELPDPYDHIGRRSVQNMNRVRAFSQARLIDDGDATALRGLADARDRDAVSAVEVEELFRRVLAIEPEDVESHVRLVGVLLAAGRPQAASDAFDDAAGTLAGAFDEDELAERVFVPIAREAIAAGSLPLASRAAIAARGALGTSDAQELDRLVEGLVETLEYGEFVASHRLGTQWWTAPEILADFDIERRPLSRWLAGRVDALDDASVTIHYADVILPVDVDHRPQRAWTSFPIADLENITLDQLPHWLPGTILEIGIYGDGDQAGSTVARVVSSKMSLSLPDSELPLDRYVNQ